MRGSLIGPLNNDPQGRFLEGIIDDTSKPGTWMEIVPGSAEVGGRIHYRHYQPSADADPRQVIILLEDRLQGKIFSDAYVSGTRCFLYAPLVGDEMNVLAAPATGTGSLSSFTVGERLTGQHTTGQFIQEATSSVNGQFVVREHIAESPVDTAILVFCERA